MAPKPKPKPDLPRVRCAGCGSDDIMVILTSMKGDPYAFLARCNACESFLDIPIHVAKLLWEEEP